MKGFIQAQALGYVMCDPLLLEGHPVALVAPLACSPYSSKAAYRMYVNAKFIGDLATAASKILRRRNWVFLTGKLRACVRTRLKRPSVGTYVDMDVDHWEVIHIKPADSNPKNPQAWPDIVALPEGMRPPVPNAAAAEEKIQQGVDQIEREREGQT